MSVNDSCSDKGQGQFVTCHSLSDSDQTFDNFAVEKSNELAYDAAITVAMNRTLKRPVIIHSQHGYGKTHLLHAIETYVRKEHSVLFISAEIFINDLINSFCAGEEAEVLDKYSSVEYLLIDDVHTFDGKEQTLKVILDILSELNSRGSQIVMAVAASPDKLEDLTSQLFLFIEQAIQVEIHAPEEALRGRVFTQFMYRKYGNDIPISDEVLEWIVKNHTDFRSLMGAGNKINAYMELCNQSFDSLDDVVALFPKSSIPISPPTAEEIIKKVGGYFELLPEGIFYSKSEPENINVTMTILYLLRHYANLPFFKIVKYFDCEYIDIVIACHKVEQLMHENDGYKTAVKEISTQLIFRS